VACLCARWCRLCESYRATFDAVATARAHHQWVYVDIEDEADLVHAIDVENFPTLLIAEDQRVLFLGVITPQPDTLQRLLRAAEEGSLPSPAWTVDADDTAALLNALRALAAR